jgi:hypothetical protein
MKKEETDERERENCDVKRELKKGGENPHAIIISNSK